MDILNRILELLGNREQNELTSYLGLNAVAFSEWKSGKSKSYRKYLIEISEFFNVSIDYLVYGKEQPNVEHLRPDQQELLNNYENLHEREQGRVLQFISDLIELQSLSSDTESASASDTARPTSTNLNQKKHLS